MLSWEKPLVKPMAPGSILHHISFPSTSYFCRRLFCNLYFPIYTTKYQKYLSYYLYQISLSQVTVKGLTTHLSRWLRGYWLFVQVLGDLCVVSYWIDTLVLKTEGNTYATLLHHPFLFKGKPTHAQEVARRISGAVAGEVYTKVNIPSTHHKPLSPALHYLPFTSRFPLPHF